MHSNLISTTYGESLWVVNSRGERVGPFVLLHHLTKMDYAGVPYTELQLRSIDGGGPEKPLDWLTGSGPAYADGELELDSVVVADSEGVGGVIVSLTLGDNEMRVELSLFDLEADLGLTEAVVGNAAQILHAAARAGVHSAPCPEPLTPKAHE